MKINLLISAKKYIYILIRHLGPVAAKGIVNLKQIHHNLPFGLDKATTKLIIGLIMTSFLFKLVKLNVFAVLL